MNDSHNILPYVYMCTHKETKKFYIGYRYKNKVPSFKDLGNYYFTSSFEISKATFAEYDTVILAEFFDSDAAYDFEQKLISEHWKNPLLINKSCLLGDGTKKFKNCKITDKSRAAHIRGLAKFRKNFTDEEWSERLMEFASTAKFYNNGIDEKRFYPAEVPAGWVLGALHIRSGHKKANQVIKQKLDNMTPSERKAYQTRRHLWSEDAASSQATKMKNKKWVNDGLKSRMVDLHDLSTYLSSGWNQGRLNLKEK